jgi:hypothetical protein
VTHYLICMHVCAYSEYYNLVTLAISGIIVDKIMSYSTTLHIVPDLSYFQYVLWIATSLLRALCDYKPMSR